MIQDIEQGLPEHWRGVFRILAGPITWLFPFQTQLLRAASSSDVWVLTLGQWVFLMLPALAVVAGLWCTMLSAYTIPFRSNRIHFVRAVLVSWWDAFRSIWLFWSGMGKFVFVAVGSFLGALRVVAQVLMELARELFELPFALTGAMTRSFRQPGVPWLAFLMTIIWSALEALIFTYILTGTFAEILSDLVGSESHRWLGPLLYIVLFFMISGSFACMQVLVEAIQTKQWQQIVQMLVVEVFVMFVEVMFLYRELVDALTPWISAKTGVQLGLLPVILMASFGWMGVRGMVWFLFARYGTPTLLAIISRQRLPQEEAEGPTAQAMAEQRWETVLGRLKRDQEWFEAKGQALLEAAILPAFQVIAAALNFPLVLVTGQPIFSLPFKSLADVGETRALLESVASFRGAK